MHIRSCANQQCTKQHRGPGNRAGAQSGSSTALGSSFEGNTVALNAGKDLTVQGSNVVSDAGTSLAAKGNVNILAAQNTSSNTNFSQTNKSGLMGGGGLSVSIGKGAAFTAGGDGKTLVQVNPNGSSLNPSTIDPKLAAYIVEQTGGANTPYKDLYNQVTSANKGPVVDPNAGLNKLTPAANGCVTAECAAGLAPVTKPNDAAAAIGVGTALTGAGALTGNPVLIGSGVNLLGQGIKSGFAGTNDVSLKEAAISGATGILGAAATEIQAVKTIIQQGGVAATTTNATIGAGTNVIGDTATKVVNGDEITLKGVAGNLVTGALGGVVLPKNPVVPAAATEVLNALKEKVLQGENK